MWACLPFSNCVDIAKLNDKSLKTHKAVVNYLYLKLLISKANKKLFSIVIIIN